MRAARGVATGFAALCLAGSSLVVATLATGAASAAPPPPALRFVEAGALSWAPGSSGELRSVSCPSARRCVAVGATAAGRAAWASAAESEGTWRWSGLAALPAIALPADPLTAVSCPTPTSCVAVGWAAEGLAAAQWDAGDAVTASAHWLDGAWRWTTPAALPAGSTGVDRLASVSCPTPSTCVAVGTTAQELGIATVATLHGARWTWGTAAIVPADASGVGELRGVSCATPSTCVAVGDDASDHFAAPSAAGTTSVGRRDAAGGWTWTAERTVAPDATGASELVSVSCPVAGRCDAVGADATGAGVVVLGASGGTGWSWSAAATFPRSGPVHAEQVSSVSCTPTSCVAVGTATGTDSVFARAPGPRGAAGWAPARPVPHGPLTAPVPESVACPGPDDCVQVGVDASGRAFASATLSTPEAVRDVGAAAGNARALVHWSPPAFDGGARIGSYTVTSAPGGRTCSVAVRDVEVDRCEVLGLSNGTPYRFVVTADNGVGLSAPSVPTARVAPTPFQPPVASPFTAAVLQRLATAPDVVSASVYDVLTGQQWSYDPTSTQHTASIVKVDILATLLYDEQREHVAMAPATRRLATAMIEESDNDAAQALYVQVGQAPGLAAFNQLVGLTGTTPNWAWGFTDTTALDQTRLVRLFAAPNAILDGASRDVGLSLMRHVVPDQAWGVSFGVAPGAAVALKNGWYPTAALDWQVNSIGWIDGQGRSYVVAVLSKDNATMGDGVSTIEALSALVWANLARASTRR